MSIFGPEKPSFDNTWRAIAALFALAVGGLTVFVFASASMPLPPTEVSVFFDTLRKSTLIRSVAGGDVIVAPPQPEPPKLPKLVGQPFTMEKLTAESVLVKDRETGAALLAKNEYSPRSIASLTKLMSAIIILEKNPDWTKIAVVIADPMIDTHMYAGDTYTLDELWHAALVGSSNKAIYTLADAVGWPREGFVERMNEKARELGLSNTHFVDPTGLDAENLATASDLAILLKEALRQEKIKEAMLTEEYNVYSKERNKKHHIWNTNWLLLGWVTNTFTEIRGGKTGYIPSSGYNFVTEVADDKGHALDVVVLGATTHEARFTEARDVAKWAFENFEWP